MDAKNTKGKITMTRSEAGRLGAIKSRATQMMMKQKRIDEYNKNPQVCCFCGKAIPYKNRRGRFCSSSCSASFYNKKRAESAVKKYKKCLNCGVEFTSRFKDAKFCCFNCSTEYKKEKNSIKFYDYVEKTGCFPSGTGKTTEGEVIRSNVRKYLESKYGHRCSICGNTEWMGKEIPLIVDHIDGDPYNCKVDNFRLVCGNCDMQLDTYKGRNKGHGRSWRKKYTKNIDIEA